MITIVLIAVAIVSVGWILTLLQAAPEPPQETAMEKFDRENREKAAAIAAEKKRIADRTPAQIAADLAEEKKIEAAKIERWRIEREEKARQAVIDAEAQRIHAAEVARKRLDKLEQYRAFWGFDQKAAKGDTDQRITAADQASVRRLGADNEIAKSDERAFLVDLLTLVKGTKPDLSYIDWLLPPQ